jgi:alpha-galactosidase
VVNIIDVNVVGGPDIRVSETRARLGSGIRMDVTLHNEGPVPAQVDRVGIVIEQAPSGRVLEHGWQSWSVVRRCSPDDPRGQRTESPAWSRSMHLADPGRAGKVVAGDQFLLTEAGLAGFLDCRRHLSTVEIQSDGWLLTAWALLDRVLLTPGEAWPLDPFWLAGGEPAEVYSEFAGHWSAVSGARVAGPPPPRPGWCSWYEYFTAVTPGAVLDNLALAAAHSFGLVQIDDGYQEAIGDWLSPAPGWSKAGERPRDVAQSIVGAGLKAGLWTAPFLAGKTSRLATEHPDWLVRDAGGQPVTALDNPGWAGLTYALDTTRPEVLDHLRAVYAELTDWGFGYHKIDFCYAAAVPGERYGDAWQTRGQALRSGLAAVRDGIGDDAFLLGCGCPFGPAVGIVDAMRVSADVAPYWSPAQAWPGFEESAPAAVNAIQASVLRAPLHGRLWLNDSDCLLMRPTGTGLSQSQRAVLADTIAGTGAFTVVSDDLSRYGHKEWELLAAATAVMAEQDVPLDLVDPFSPAVTVRSEHWELTVDWSVPSSWLRRRPAP